MTRELTLERLKAVMDYDPNTGIFTRKEPQNNRFRKKAGSPITTKNAYGYVVIRIDGKLYIASRLAWFICTGKMSNKQIDHINCVRSDDRIINLREADRFENARNQPLRKNNTSGYKGVSWNKANKKWIAMLTYERKAKYLGSFDCPQKAYEAYCAAADKYHQQFARLE